MSGKIAFVGSVAEHLLTCLEALRRQNHQFQIKMRATH